MPVARAVKPFIARDEVKEARSRRKERQAFYTPDDLVAMIVEDQAAAFEDRVLEPSAGDGRFVHALRQAGYRRVDFCEIDESCHARCVSYGGTPVGTDFLAYPASEAYAWIVMNPPFDRRTQDRHYEHAYAHLKPGGRITGIASAAFADRLIAEECDFPGCNHLRWEELIPREFSGTLAKTILVEIHKPYPGESRFDEWFANGTTHEAAILLENDKACYDRYRDLLAKFRAENVGPEESAKRFAAAFRQNVRFCYGVNWGEVVNYLAAP